MTHSPGVSYGRPRSIADGEAQGKTDGFGFASNDKAESDPGYLSVGPDVDNQA